MDGMDGLQTLRRMREEHLETPAIINTAFGTLATATEALRHGASDFLLKPSTSEVIVHRIRKVLDERKARLTALAAESAESKLRSLQTLAGGMAHDLNNQLTVILSNVAGLLDRMAPDDPMREELEEVYASSTAIASMGQKLLGYAGGGHFEIEAIDLTVQLPLVLKKLALKLRTQAQRSVRLSLHMEGEQLFVEADRKELAEVIEHLLTNAFEALTGDDDRIEVELLPRVLDQAFIDEHLLLARLQPGAYVCVRITDNGVGMDTATLDNAFDPFFSTKFTGRGLGLSTVQGILGGHGGGILLRSRPNEGTTAELLLPLAPDAQVQPPPVPHTNIEIPLAPPAPSKSSPVEEGCIMIIEDETMVRKLAEKALLKMGCRVESFSNGPDGLAALERDPGRVRLVLLDLVMPEMSGQEVLEEIRRIRPEIKVLLTSGYHSTEVANRFETVRPDGFLAKPYPISDLREKVSSLLES
jgi:signal transduction histidine kinase